MLCNKKLNPFFSFKVSTMLSFLSRGSWRDTAWARIWGSGYEDIWWNLHRLWPRTWLLFVLETWPGNNLSAALSTWKPEPLPGLHALKSSWSHWHKNSHYLATDLSSLLCYLHLERGQLLAQQLQTNSSLAKLMNFSAIWWAELHLLQQGLNSFQVCPCLGTLPEP